MHDVDTEFASLLCSRLCHDLLSPVGAVNNGIELLADEPDAALRAQYLELLADSARASADRLKFYRLAFGAGAGFGERVAVAEVRQAAEGLVRGNRRIAFGWTVDVDTLDRDAIRILLNLLLVACDALARGGRLDVCVERDELVVRAEAERLALSPAVSEMLAGMAAVADSHTAPAALANALARRSGRELLFSREGGLLLLGASGPAA